MNIRQAADTIRHYLGLGLGPQVATGITPEMQDEMRQACDAFAEACEAASQAMTKYADIEKRLASCERGVTELYGHFP